MELDLKSLQIDRSERPASSASRWSRRWIIGGISIFGLLALARVLYNVKVSAGEEVTTVRVTAYSAGSSAAGGPGVVLNATGYIVAHHTIDVSSKVVGKVAWIGIEKGDHVKQGQVLVRLEDQEYRAQLEQAKANLQVMQANLAKLEHGSRPQEIESARAAVEQAEADFENNAMNLKRTKDLARQGISPQQTLDNAQAQYDMAKAKLDSAKKNYELVKIGPRVEDIEYARAQVAQSRAQVDYAQTMLDSTLIRSPITGTVLDRLVERGEMVTSQAFSTSGGAKASVAQLADLNDLQVELDINQNDFAKLTPRMNANVVADAYPDRIYKGIIAEVAPQADRQKATIQVKVKVLHPDGYLRPEMNASVAFLSDQKTEAGGSTARPLIVVPASAVRNNAVYVVLDGKAVRRPVKPGPVNSRGVQILDGLIGGEDLIVNPPANLQDGARVRAKTS